MLTRLGEASVDAFTIMKIAGHSSITVSQRYVHPSHSAMEQAFAKLEALNERNAPSVPLVQATRALPPANGLKLNAA
jgi:hypothetical protein